VIRHRRFANLQSKIKNQKSKIKNGPVVLPPNSSDARRRTALRMADSAVTGG
jgi:hypothetical protein